MAKILHVDDDPRWRNIVVLSLVEAGHTVVSFSTLTSAKQAAETEPYDAFVVDGSIDVRNDGYDWARMLRQQGKKVVVLSSASPLDYNIGYVDKFGFDSATLIKLLS